MTFGLRVSLLAGLSACTGMLLAPSVAHACSCFGETKVAQQQTLAENAQLVFGDSCGGVDPFGVTVTVDGQAAALVGQPGAGANAYLRAIEPAVSEGQTVVIDFGPGAFETEQHMLTVGPPDTEAPTLSAPQIEVEEYDADLNCNGETTQGTRVSASVPATDEDDNVRYTFTVYFDGDVVSESTEARFGNGSTVGASFTSPLYPSEVCVDVIAVDAAGNEATGTSDCIEGLGGDADKAGCGCTSEPGDAGWLALPLFGLLFAARRRLG